MHVNSRQLAQQHYALMLSGLQLEGMQKPAKVEPHYLSPVDATISVSAMPVVLQPDS